MHPALAPPPPTEPPLAPGFTLEQSLRALPDLASRRAALLARIQAQPEATARGLEGLLRSAVRGGTGARDAAVALASALIELHDGEPKPVEALREAALAHELPLLAALLVEAPPHRALAPGGRLREICVPERSPYRFWTRALERQLLLSRPYFRYRLDGFMEQLIWHPSPVLIARLLGETWLRPRDAVSIAARRPSSAAIARAVARSSRWLQRLEVREALVQNPFTPTELALALLPTIHLGVLRHLAAAGDAHPLVAAAAQRLLASLRE